MKVQTLECFQSMVKTLDKVGCTGALESKLIALQATLTTKLVPLLAKIKTKGEPMGRVILQVLTSLQSQQ